MSGMSGAAACLVFTCNLIAFARQLQVRLQLPTSAINVTLLAFPARTVCCCAPCCGAAAAAVAAVGRYLLSARRSAANPPQRRAAGE